MGRKSLVERFTERFLIGDGCWEWQTATGSKGYGAFSDGKRSLLAHRFSYELFVGPIPEGLQIDHLCRNRKCVRPDHLEAVTQQVNMSRGESFSAINGRKTHCKRGHEFSPENTYLTSFGSRQCKTCSRIREAAKRVAE